jgi:hypothetical protein
LALDGVLLDEPPVGLVPNVARLSEKSLFFVGFLDIALGMKRLPCHRLG